VDAGIEQDLRGQVIAEDIACADILDDRSVAGAHGRGANASIGLVDLSKEVEERLGEVMVRGNREHQGCRIEELDIAMVLR
jgi:hypothetical protein